MSGARESSGKTDPPRRRATVESGSASLRPTNAFVEFKREDLEQSITARFEQQTRRFPDRIAVKTKRAELTYEELDSAANRVAQAVLIARPGTSEAVALLLEQGTSVITSLLGVLKAGKPYVPLEPSNPRARLGFILADSQAGLIVTNNRNLALARDLAENSIPVINVDELDARGAAKHPGVTVSPDALAYIMYTSGSTGTPKGVVDKHRNVLHEIAKYTNVLHICAEDRLTLIRAFSGVGASMDIFTALLNGAALYPLNIQEEGLGGLADWMIQQEITIYHSVPTIYRHFVRTLRGNEVFRTLRILRLGGEVVRARDVAFLKTHCPDDCLFLNVLGATETLTFRWYFVNKNTRISGSVVPVGYEHEDADVLVLNEQGEEVGVGQIGEIAVKSRYLSPGYWRRPDLTRASFVPDPVDEQLRTYYTGDLGRLLPDGCLIHLGRKDLQVKIRGYRVEVAEIEQSLLDMEGVKEAVVVAGQDGRGDTSLAAYLVCTGGMSTLTLRRSLRERLPDYMIPAQFYQLDALPRTATGKVDRARLPRAGGDRLKSAAEDAAPRTPTEQTIADIWQRALETECIGMRDNFMDLGGDSLMVLSVVAEIEDKLGVSLRPRQVFTQTLVQLAASCDRQRRGGFPTNDGSPMGSV